MMTAPSVLNALNSNACFVGSEVAALILGGALLTWGMQARWMQVVESAFIGFANRRYLAILSPAILVVVGRLALLPLFPVPVPGVHDEFSYLLSGATFALGRVSNPTHPLWHFFESFHILQSPHYVSMYPVAQGLFLAFGDVLGSPWIGVLLSVALFCSAVTWALQGWLAPQWALLGGVFAVLKFGLVSYWIDSYWGGAIPAIGGALVFGSVPRLYERVTPRSALWLVIGILLLANSRPYEGLVFVLCVAAWWTSEYILSGFWRVSGLSLRTVAPALLTLMLGVLLMGIYFFKTTDSAIEMPYVRYAKEYEITRPFIWNNLRPEPAYRHIVMRTYYEQQISLLARARSFGGWTVDTLHKASVFCMFYVWPGLVLTIIMLPKVLATREGRVAVAVIAGVLLGISLEIWPMMIHYPAPVAVAALLLVMCSIREVRSFMLGRWPIGVGLSRAIPGMCVCMLTFRIGAEACRVAVPHQGIVSFFTVRPGNEARQQLIAALHKAPGFHLVIVRYSKDHDVSQEWVYNSPSIDRARVVWARDMTLERTKYLREFFKDRHIWLLEPDKTPIALRPYSQ
jgi:hypothetical protein